jgi:hypothetical protein
VISGINERYAAILSQTMRMRVVRLDRDNRELTKAFQNRESVNANDGTCRSIGEFAIEGDKGAIPPNVASKACQHLSGSNR